MDVLDYLKLQIKSMRSLQSSVLDDITDEVISHEPIGTVSSIGVIWLHMIADEDNFLSIISGEETLWDSEGWKDRFGLEKAPNFGQDWTEFENGTIPMDLLRDYTSVVRQRTLSYLDSIVADSLEESVKFFTDDDPKAEVWVLLIGHTLIHSGEIAAIKGVLGGRGLPF